MSLLNEILEYNHEFVSEKDYEPYITTKFPDKQIVILTCMDTRLEELLPRAMNIKNGDVKIVKSAGALINHPFGGIMRSLLIAVYELQVNEVYIVGHYDCGMSTLEPNQILSKMIDRGISQETIDMLTYSGIELDEWLSGFKDVQERVKHSVDMVKNHPLMVKDIPIHGLVINPSTGQLDLVVDGNL